MYLDFCSNIDVAVERWREREYTGTSAYETAEQIVEYLKDYYGFKDVEVTTEPSSEYGDRYWFIIWIGEPHDKEKIIDEINERFECHDTFDGAIDREDCW